MSISSTHQMCSSGGRPSRTDHVAGAQRSAGGNPYRTCSGRMHRKRGAAQGASRSETQVLLRGSIRHAHPDASRRPFGCDASKRRQPQAAYRGSACSALSPPVLSRLPQLERRARHIPAGVLGHWPHRVLEVRAEGNTHIMTRRVTATLPLPGASSTARMASDATRSARWTEKRGDRH